jgi:hypothetical protein
VQQREVKHDGWNRDCYEKKKTLAETLWQTSDMCPLFFSFKSYSCHSLNTIFAGKYPVGIQKLVWKELVKLYYSLCFMQHVGNIDVFRN